MIVARQPGSVRVVTAVVRTTCLCPHVWQWQIGVVVIFLAWINLIIVCAKFPNIGIYVIMFGKIWGTFLKVLLLSILLVATFGLTFYMTFSEPQFQVIAIHQFCVSANTPGTQLPNTV